MQTRWADIEDDVNPAPRWGDMVDDEEEFGRGSNVQRTATLEDGIRTETEYTDRGGVAYKITTKYKQKTVWTKSNEFIDERKKWRPFSKCHNPELVSDYGPNRPVRSDEEVALEMNKEKAMKAVGVEEKFWEESIQICEAILNDAKKKKYDANEMRKKKEEEDILQEAREQKENATIQGGRTEEKYTPPSQRAGGPPQENRNENTLRVTNLAETCGEGDLQELFGRFGFVQRVFMPRHKEGEREGQHKNFAFIQFKEKAHAEQALRGLNSHGYDHLILSVSWAQPPQAK